MDLFAPRVRPELGQVQRVKRWVEAALGTSDGTIVMVTELACTEPGCPPLETVIAVLEGDGSRRQATIHKSVVDVTGHDVSAVVPRLRP